MDQIQLSQIDALSNIETLIGATAATVISAPEYNLNKLKDLLVCLNSTQLGPFNAKEHRKTIIGIHRLIAKTATKIFEDIIPNYRIKEKEVDQESTKISKDVARLRQYERNFSSTYKNSYLNYLKRMLDCLKKTPTSTFYTHLIETDHEDQLALAETAIECFGRILSTHPHFNFRDQLVGYLVESNSQTKYTRCAEIAHNYLAKTLSQDKLGEISLEITSKICELTKQRKLSVSRLLYKTLLDLKLIDVKTADADEKSRRKAEKEKIAAMKKKQSRKEKKRNKKMKKLKGELLETEAHTTTGQKLKFHRVILKKLFVTYFRLLRYHEDLAGEGRETMKFVKLLPPVLEGISKFAHLIDVKLCNDIFPFIKSLLENKRIPTNCKLHCLGTVFSMFRSLEKELDKVDPEGFYKQLYVILTEINGHTISEEEFSSLSSCVDTMLVKRARSVNNSRYCAFVKRLLVLTLNVEPKFVRPLLEMIQTLFLQRPTVGALLDSSNCSDYGSGNFDMEIDDPDYSHAESSVAWEFHMLRNHSEPSIRDITNRYMKGIES